MPFEKRKIHNSSSSTQDSSHHQDITSLARDPKLIRFTCHEDPNYTLRWSFLNLPSSLKLRAKTTENGASFFLPPPPPKKTPRNPQTHRPKKKSAPTLEVARAWHVDHLRRRWAAPSGNFPVGRSREVGSLRRKIWCVWSEFSRSTP